MTTTTPVPGSTDADRRQLRDTVTAGLADPLAEIMRTLQRLALAHLGPADQALDPNLLARARTLAHGLQQVIEEIVADGTRAGTLDSREVQATVLVAGALDTAATTVGTLISDREISVSCASHAAIVTNPVRFQELLTTMLEAAAAACDGDVRLTADRRRGELLLELDDIPVATDALDRLRRLARGLGGSVQVSGGSATSGVCVWLPQQRLEDAAPVDPSQS